MASPSTAITSHRPTIPGSFMEFDLAADRLGFVSQRVLPVVEVAKQTGTFGKITLEDLLQAGSTARAPGGEYPRGEGHFDDVTYSTKEQGWEETIDDRERAMYVDFFDAHVMATQRSIDKILRNAEIRAATLLFNSTTWTGSGLTTGVTNEWDDGANATPIADINAAAQKVANATGMYPNALIINRKVFRNLRNIAEIQNLVKNQNFMDVRQREIRESEMASVFDLEFVIVADPYKNTANEAAAASLSPVWSDEFAMVCRVARTADFKEPCIGRIFHWSEDGSDINGTVETYREDKIRSDVVRVRHEVDEIVLYKEMGHLLSNITT